MATEVVPSGLSMPIPKTDSLASAEESLLASRDSLAKQVAELDKMIANLRDMRNTGTTERPLPSVKPDEFRGMRAVDALEVYLRARRGVRIPLSQAVEDLVAGGVHPGQPRGKQSDPLRLIAHTIKIALPNKRDMFAWMPSGFLKGVRDEEIMLWLAESADVPKRRARSVKRA